MRIAPYFTRTLKKMLTALDYIVCNNCNKNFFLFVRVPFMVLSTFQFNILLSVFPIFSQLKAECALNKTLTCE
jgi:hypothetical protein